jgi:hypothetical protein
MLFTNLTPVSLPGRFAGRFASFALAALFAGGFATAQSSNPAQSPSPAQSSNPAQSPSPAQSSNPAPGTAPMQQPSSSSSSTQQSGTAAPGTAPIKSHGSAAALAPGKGPSYDNKWDVYGGLTFMNGQAGQNITKRYNMGGGEGQYTYWLTHKIGVAADYRFGAGTTPVLPVGDTYNRVLVMQHIFAGGVQYRGVRNRYVAINYHAFAGGDYGIFDTTVKDFPFGPSPNGACPADGPGNLGLYCNHVAPWAALGGSIDFNQGQRFAVRLAPDLTLEHFGTETRIFFGISMGVLYRGGRH